MLNKLKNKLQTMGEDEKEGQIAKKKIQIQVLSAEEVKTYKAILQRFKDNVETLQEISKNNVEGLNGYIAEREKQKLQKAANGGENGEQGSEGEDEKFTFEEDINEIKEILQEIDGQIKELISMENGLIEKVNKIQQSEAAQQGVGKNNQDLIAKYEAQIIGLRKSEENNKEILTTLGQQSQLYLKQMKELQEKCTRLQKQVQDRNVLVANLKEEKNMLMEMRNDSVNGQIPEVEALKNKLAEFDKRLLTEKSRVADKEKEIETLKLRMQQDRVSLQKIADELKQKQLKSKKVIDKYERSKTEIRKFREEKTQFIKQLNMEVARISGQLSQQKKKTEEQTKQIQNLKAQVQNLQNDVNKNESRKIELQSNRSELVQVRKQLHEKNMQQQDQQQQLKKLKQQNEQLQLKRKQLLQALQKPVNHEIRTLQKILRALDKLYKEYITTVFQDGNIVGFETKITYIISNVQQIKQDLLL